MQGLIKLSARTAEGLSLAKLVKNFLASNEMLTEDRERLRKTVRVGPGCK